LKKTENKNFLSTETKQKKVYFNKIKFSFSILFLMSIQQQYERTFRVIVFGRDNIGKTEFLKKWADNTTSFSSDNYEPTIGIDLHTRVVPHANRNYKVQVFDTSGQPRFEPIIRSNIRGCVCAFLCFDVNDRETFSVGVPHFLDLVNNAGFNQKEGAIYMILVGCKADQTPLVIRRKVKKIVAPPSPALSSSSSSSKRQVRIPGSPKVDISAVSRNHNNDDDDDDAHGHDHNGGNGNSNGDDNEVEEETTIHLQRQVSIEEASAFAKQNRFIAYCDTSAREGTGIDVPFEVLVRKMYERGPPTGKINIPMTPITTATIVNPPPPVIPTPADLKEEEEESNNNQLKKKETAKKTGWKFYPSLSQIFSFIKK
jgi:small GTP-binding protein